MSESGREMTAENTVMRYYVDGSGTDDVKVAFWWLLRYATEHLCSAATVFVYDAQDIRNLSAALGIPRATALEKRRQFQECGITIHRHTASDHGYHGGPVLAVWVTEEDLLDRLDNWRVPAICVVPYGDIPDWKARWRPTEIHTGKVADDGVECVTNPVVIEALQDVTSRVNLLVVSVHPVGQAAEQAFKLLKQAGESFEPEQIRAWAARHGWGTRLARELADVASSVRDARRVRIETHPVWKDGVVDDWRRRASVGDNAAAR